MTVKVGDKIITKKQHPCGSLEWLVVRTGADIKIKCLGCGRTIMLSEPEFAKRVKKIVEA